MKLVEIRVSDHTGFIKYNFMCENVIINKNLEKYGLVAEKIDESMINTETCLWEDLQ